MFFGALAPRRSIACAGGEEKGPESDADASLLRPETGRTMARKRLPASRVTFP